MSRTFSTNTPRLSSRQSPAGIEGSLAGSDSGNRRASLAEGSINRVEVKVPHFLEEFGAKLFPIRYVLRPRKVDQVFGHEFRESTHKVVEADFVRSRHLDNTFDRLCERGIADRTGDVIRRDGLEKGRRESNRLSSGVGVHDAADELRQRPLFRQANGRPLPCSMNNLQPQ